ncbi:MAG TPA: hypothetical protein PKE30_02655 [Niabella sp.]|nr:hypothetical protein [Niabella sp.]
MKAIVSKIQYTDFEPGEFIDEQERLYDETVKLIESYPWQEQRRHLRIALTNPSVTLCFENSCFLKLATYYNSKYVLYNMDIDGVVYVKSFVQLSETYEYIKSFFENGYLDTGQLKKHSSRKKRNRIHFISQDFLYEITPERCKKYLSDVLMFQLYIIAAFCLLLLITQGIDVVFWTLLVMVFLWSPILMLMLNYYRFSKGKLLKLSKGNPVFLYGDKTNPAEYYKDNIEMVTILKNTSSRCPWSDFAVFKVVFIDRTVIKIPTLFSDYELLYDKFPCQRKVIKHRAIPFVKQD